ncbi:MAG TPA: acylphosphatase [Gemmatimonadales bacterium]|nr:acylphosphatase [Gemmatimonadales bacterium]
MTRRYLVSGLVQGVGYRWFVLRHAQLLRLRGFARNLADGRVEVVADGTPEQLAELEARLRAGPARSQVEQVEVTDLGASSAPGPGFEIR